MSSIPLTFACGLYDRTMALLTGDVRVEGVDLNYLPIEAPREIFDRMVGGKEFDVSELSMSEHVSMLGAGKRDFVALPVFPSKMFRHGFVYINKKSGIKTPKDLEGRRIGVALYTQTAAIFQRGMLKDEYGVDLSGVKWVQGAAEKVGSHGNPSALPLLKPVDLVQSDKPYSLSEMLARGEIDAMIGSRHAETLGKHPDVARLWPNYREVERDYYRKTKIFPIMHTVAFRRDVYEANPWLANSFYKAFVQAKDWGMHWLRFSGHQSTMFPWHSADLDEIDANFGGDAWPWGIEENRPTLEALIRYMVDQNFIPKSIPLEDIFAPLPGSMGH
jgi:4,5-dihydroxyphthalate decarboxylase